MFMGSVAGDPREWLVQNSMFTIRPEPLEGWIREKRLTRAAEAVFWLHWQQGHTTKTWCSVIPVQTVASKLKLNEATVKRAHRRLVELKLLCRRSPGRDPYDQFKQATSVTEVILPPEFMPNLSQHAMRRRRRIDIPAGPTVVQGKSNHVQAVGEAPLAPSQEAPPAKAAGRPLFDKSTSQSVSPAGAQGSSLDTVFGSLSQQAPSRLALEPQDSLPSGHQKPSSGQGYLEGFPVLESTPSALPDQAQEGVYPKRLSEGTIEPQGARSSSAGGQSPLEPRRLPLREVLSALRESALGPSRGQDKPCPSQEVKPVEGPQGPAEDEAADSGLEPGRDPGPLTAGSGCLKRSSRRDYFEIKGRMSIGERGRYDEALRLRRPLFELDSDTRLSLEEGMYLERSLVSLWEPDATPLPAKVNSKAENKSEWTISRLAELRNRIGVLVTPELLEERVREVHWALSKGKLSTRSWKHAMHIALKLIREGTWTRPRGMPPNWVIALSGAGVHRPRGVAARR